MLTLIVRHSPILMIVFYALGFLLPDAAAWLLPHLPAILFFLMCFSLIGINQRQLLHTLLQPGIWRFAAGHVGLSCLLMFAIAWLIGIRGDLLIAIAAVGATAPLFATGALVQSVGLDPLPAMARTIAATLLMPLILWILLQSSGDAHLNLALYSQKLIIYIAGPIALSILLRATLPEPWLRRLYPRVAQYAVLLVFAFPFGLTTAFRHLYDREGTSGALHLMAISALLCFAGFALAGLAYRKHGKREAIAAAMVGGSRNVLLTLTITSPYLGDTFLALIGALQLPVFAVPIIAKSLIKHA
ncbi:MAG: hypothetical protein Q4D61_02890 [Cardiobacteriaceae bacterium]|nr:hypothetical protein [Cardiobacteriaceae bacterium]